MIINIESPPQTGKHLLVKTLFRKAGYQVGNVPLGETLRHRAQSDFTGWTFEYCLAKILSLKRPRAARTAADSRVVYMGLGIENTLLRAMHSVGLIKDNQLRVLQRCCKQFVPHDVRPDLWIYVRADPHTLSNANSTIPLATMSSSSSTSGNNGKHPSTTNNRRALSSTSATNKSKRNTLLGDVVAGPMLKMRMVYESHIVANPYDIPLLILDAQYPFTDAVVQNQFLRCVRCVEQERERR